MITTHLKSFTWLNIAFFSALFLTAISSNVLAGIPAVNLLLSSKDKIQLVKRFDMETAGDIPLKPVIYNGEMWFNAGDEEHGDELWRSDGTEQGTVMAADINPGPLGSTPLYLTVYNNALYFFADDNSNGCELRKTVWDSTSATYQTTLVKDIKPGADSAFTDSNGHNLVNFRGELFFVADDGFFGKEIWRTDGTEAGTLRVTDIAPGAADASPEYLTVYDTTLSNPSSLKGKVLVFSATNVSNGKELRSIFFHLFLQTLLVEEIKNIYPGPASSSPAPISLDREFSLYNGELYFSAVDNVNGRELWKTDATNGGTVLVKNIHPTNNGLNATGTSSMVFEGELYFIASSAGADDLWKTDGTGAGTIKAFGLNPMDIYISFINTVFSDGLLFSVLNITGGSSDVSVTLWKRFWDESSMSWQALPLGDVLMYPKIHHLTNQEVAANTNLYFMGVEYDDSLLSQKTNLYKLGSGNMLTKIEKGVSLNEEEILGGFINFNNAVYFFAFDDQYRKMLLKVYP